MDATTTSTKTFLPCYWSELLFERLVGYIGLVFPEKYYDCFHRAVERLVINLFSHSLLEQFTPFSTNMFKYVETIMENCPITIPTVHTSK